MPAGWNPSDIIQRFSFTVFIGGTKTKTLHASSNERGKKLLFLSSLSGAQTHARANIHTGTHQILRTLADASVLRGTVSGSVREREREGQREREC